MVLEIRHLDRDHVGEDTGALSPPPLAAGRGSAGRWPLSSSIRRGGTAAHLPRRHPGPTQKEAQQHSVLSFTNQEGDLFTDSRFDPKVVPGGGYAR